MSLQSNVKLLRFSNNGQYLVACGNDKKSVLLNSNDFSVLKERFVQHTFQYVT